MIEFTRVDKSFGTVQAVSDLSFTVENGSVCVLIGPSGCGKSTTLRMINRLLEPDFGTIEVDGIALRDYEPSQLRLRTGYVIQSVGLLPHMSVWQNIALVPRLLKWEKKRRISRAEELLDLVGLDPKLYRDKYPRELSGGEAQRVGVARALAADPPYLLMDEPFGAVDPLTRTSLQQEFRKIQERLRKTVVLVTHDLDEAIFLGDTIALMKDGSLRQHGTAAELLTAPKDDFVADFVGSDRMIRMLQTVALRKIEGWEGDGTPTLHDALGLLLKSNTDAVDVVLPDGASRSIDFTDIRRMVQPCR